MIFSNFDSELRWQFYQKGYQAMIRSGFYFRQLVRPAFSHVYFQRAMPLLEVYAEANRNETELPPGFVDQMNACPVTMRDLLHLDYAISVGFAEIGQSENSGRDAKVQTWPGPAGVGVFIPVDAQVQAQEIPYDLGLDFDFEEDDDLFEDDPDDKKPFDL